MDDWPPVHLLYKIEKKEKRKKKKKEKKRERMNDFLENNKILIFTVPNLTLTYDIIDKNMQACLITIYLSPCFNFQE